MLVDMDVMFVAVSCLSTLQFEYIVTVLKICVCVCVFWLLQFLGVGKVRR